ncbi:cytochrome P450 family protein [Pseudonocardia xinjiangensis]|uniref:Cytochrome P450 n=1 Tax=Pseudonocardia xinjiangensis TaxID=75289 RepID=A0ABX1RSE0_9PSEU|nr:cytochrome P450 [Pseudonocardia xinjiangensis]NMH82091.1 cytochrome P450 [Pseudonocardia xinjiangensis]
MTTTPSTGPNILDPALIADPRGGFDLVREEAPVVLGRSADGTPAWYVTRYDDVRAVLGDPRFVNSPVSTAGTDAVANRDQMFEMLGISREFVPYMTSSILDVDGIDHVRLRKLVSRAFTVRRINALRPRVEEIAAALLDGLDGSVDLISEFAYPLPITVICELVGIPEADRPLWREMGAASNSIAPGAMGTAVRQMVTYTHDLIDQRRAQPADDLLTDLIRAQDEDGDQLSDVEMVTMVLALVTAGHETTANLIGNGALALLTHPDQLETLRREPELWPTAVNELMRWCGPVQIAQLRYASADVEVGGQVIAAGEAVQAVLVSANQDPRAYDEPERLDVTRRPAGRGDGHVGFGHGIHYCLGAALAKQEGEVALRSLFDRFPAMALEAAEQTWAAVPGMRQLASLPVKLR